MGPHRQSNHGIIPLRFARQRSRNISVVDTFSVFGVKVNPSDSRAIKPVGTKGDFVSQLRDDNLLATADRVIISLCKSLSLANGNRTASITVVVKLTKGDPRSIIVSRVPTFVRLMAHDKQLPITSNTRVISFPMTGGVVFRPRVLPHRRGKVQVAT